MKILVTGGAGFIGSHVADRYVAAGHQVVVLDDLSSGKKEWISASASFSQLHISKDDLEPLFQKEQFDVVNHHAAQMEVRYSVAHPSQDAWLNIVGGLRLLEKCEKYEVKKFIFASTGGAIYGEQERFPADETHPTRPCSPYGLSKFCFEQYLSYYATRTQMDCVALRYSNVYGPRQNPNGEAGVVAIFIHALLQGKTPLINGDGGQTRDFVFVHDVAEASLKALNLKGFHVINIGTGRETNINQLYEWICRSLGETRLASHGPAKPGEQRRSVISFEKAKKVLKWVPKTSMELGIEQTVKWFQALPQKTNLKKISP